MSSYEIFSFGKSSVIDTNDIIVVEKCISKLIKRFTAESKDDTHYLLKIYRMGIYPVDKPWYIPVTTEQELNNHYEQIIKLVGKDNDQ